MMHCNDNPSLLAHVQGGKQAFLGNIDAEFLFDDVEKVMMMIAAGNKRDKASHKMMLTL